MKRRYHSMQNMLPVETLSALHCDEDELKFGTETEAEKHMKTLLEKQLDTKITLKEHFAQHRKFTNPSTYTPLTELVQGACSLENYKKLEQREEEYQELQRCGLSESEIKFYISHKASECEDGREFLLNPEVHREKLDHIVTKIKEHEKELQQPEVFATAKTLNRHAMEIEKTLYVGCKTKKQLAPLVIEKPSSRLSIDDPFSHVKHVSDKLAEKIQKEQWKRRKTQSKDKETKVLDEGSGQNGARHCDTDSSPVYDMNVHHVVVPLEEEVIMKNKLSLEEIKKMAKFQNYDPGEPNKVLYLKNLHHKVTVRELQALFGIFSVNCSEYITYNVLSGRMKGQAFVHFPDTETAEKAFDYANGFILRNRPIIIEYGKKR